MTFTFTLDKDDRLQHQLFMTSQSERIQKNRRRSRMRITLILFVIALAFYCFKDELLMYTFLGYGVLIFIVHPYLLRWRYKRHYRQYINDHFKDDLLNGDINISFENREAKTWDNLTSVKISLIELEQITETGQYFFVKFRRGTYLIIPKQKIPDAEAAAHFLKELGASFKVPYTEQLNWKWA